MATSNILTDPVPELEAALKNNLWGIDASESSVLISRSFPITAEDKEAVRAESSKLGRTSERVVGKLRVITLERSDLEITLDQRGYTVSSSLLPSLVPSSLRPCPLTLRFSVSHYCAVSRDMHHIRLHSTSSQRLTHS